METVGVHTSIFFRRNSFRSIKYMLQAIPLVQQPTVVPAVWIAKEQLNRTIKHYSTKSVEVQKATEEFNQAMASASDSDKAELKRLERIQREEEINAKARKECEERKQLEELVRNLGALKMKF